MAAWQAGAALHTMAILQAYQVEVLTREMIRGTVWPPELRRATDLALRATKHTVVCSMAGLVAESYRDQERGDGFPPRRPGLQLWFIQRHVDTFPWPVRPPSFPSWDLSVVLKRLLEPPFEPLGSALKRILTLKVTLSLNTFKRVGDLQAVCQRAIHRVPGLVKAL